MHLEQLPRKQRRILALTILALMIAAVYIVLALPLLGIAESYDQKLQKISKSLATSQVVIDEGHSAKEQLQRLALTEKRYGYYLENNRPTLAAAELQRRVKQSVEKHGGSIVSSQILGEQEENGLGLHRVVLRVNLRMDLPTLQKILYELETKPPVLVLQNISLNARPSGSTARLNGRIEQQVLDASLDVMGFRKQVSENG